MDLNKNILAVSVGFVAGAATALLVAKSIENSHSNQPNQTNANANAALNGTENTIVKKTKKEDLRSSTEGSSSLRHYTFPGTIRTVSTFDDVSKGFKEVQDYITHMLTMEGGRGPLIDCWEYNKGAGGGQSNVWELGVGKSDGVIERGGVMFSSIGGKSLPPAALAKHNLPPNTSFNACGVSLVIHPLNPNIPTIHMNIRYMETDGGKWWFGGGIDVTPYYPVFSQIVDFHQRLQALCEEFQMPYDEFKRYCDRYFVNHHRREMRGVGGIFYEDLSESPRQSKQHLFEFCVSVGKLMVDYYSWVIQENLHKEYNDQQRDFQLIRRSRYAEFNLIHDRGTKFGLQSKGRVESIFCSLPAECRWRYNYSPAVGTREHFVTTRYLKPQNWVGVLTEEDLVESEVEETADPSSL